MKNPDDNLQPSIPTPNLSLLAGYFIGEGSICFRATPGGVPQLVVKIQSGDKEMLEKFAEAFGGAVCPARAKNARRQIYRWSLTNTSGQAAIRQLLPFLVGEKAQIAKLVLPLRFNVRTEPRRVSEADVLLRHEIASQVSAINNRYTVMPEYTA